MKKLLLILFVLTTVLFSACKKTENSNPKLAVDYTKPENLSGTTWKYFYTGTSPSLEWASLVFKSTSAVEGWSKYKNQNETKDWTGSFAIINTTITFNYVMDSVPETFSGTISGESMTCLMGGTTITFKKQ
ncbi:MAG: hypothetical protein ABSE72_08235 [Bacteroidales bacterium]|jgi:hypothetical protein